MYKIYRNFLIRLDLLLILFLVLQCSTNIQKIDVNYGLENQLKKLANQLIESLNKTEVTKIAVFDFQNLQGDVSTFGKYISEELITRLFKSNQFQVIERRLLLKILEEHKLGSTGLVDKSTLGKLGKIAGVDAIVSGTITGLGKYLRVNARLIDTKTGELLSVSSINISKNKNVQALLGETSSIQIQNIMLQEKEIKLGDRTPSFNAHFKINDINKIGKAWIVMDLLGVVLCNNSGEPYHRSTKGHYYNYTFINDEKVDFVNKYLTPIRPTHDFQSNSWQTIKIEIPISMLKQDDNVLTLVAGRHKRNRDDFKVKKILISMEQ